MRRFIKSLPGKVISNLIVLSLILPSISLVLARRAEAQVQVNPTWAVVRFKNDKEPHSNFGQVAADAVASELLKTNAYDVTPQEQVDRAVKSLGISLPVDGTNLMRLAQELHASTIVTGEIANYKVTNTGAGKMATVTVRTVVYDTASAIAVNGSIQTADSTTRPGDVSDETLINDAIQSAANQAVRDIQGKALPTGTVLNTTSTETMVNKGDRAGFKDGQEVIVLRGREQVASGHVKNVDPDFSTITIDRSRKGVMPGDRVRVIFSVPDLIVDANGGAHAAQPRPHISSSLVTTLIIVALLGVLLSHGSTSDPSVLTSVTAEATSDEALRPAVQVGWSPNGFAKGTSTRTQWQVWRSDVVDSPVLVAPGIETSTLDRVDVRNVTYTSFTTIDGRTCDNTSYNNSSATGVVGIKAGRPYIYSVELIYALSSLDLPGGGGSGSTSTSSTSTSSTSTSTTSTSSTSTSSTSTSTTNGTATSGGFGLDSDQSAISGFDAFDPMLQTTSTTQSTSSTSTSTGTTSTSGGTGSTGTVTTCYFQSQRTTSRGQATPLNMPVLIAPTEGASVGAPQQFSFQSAVGATPILVSYEIQMSDSIMFPSNRTFTFTAFTKNTTTTISTPAIDTTASGLPSYIRGASTVYWRVGAANPDDKPGPVPDSQTHQRYIFSQGRSFVRPGGPPPPP